MELPEAFVVIDQVKPVAVPPEAMKARLPLGGVEAVTGEIDTPAVTATLRVATLLRESVT